MTVSRSRSIVSPPSRSCAGSIRMDRACGSAAAHGSRAIMLLLAHGLRGEEQEGPHLGIAELIIVLKLPHRRTASQLPQQLRHGNAMPFDRRFAPKNLRVRDDTCRKLALHALSPWNSLASGRASISH